MNARQELFVAEYLRSRNASEAAVRAGYAESRAKQTGYDLLRKPDVAAAIDKADRERRASLGVEADQLVAWTVEVIERAMGRVPARQSEDAGDVFEFHPTPALRGIEILMKHLGISGVERHEVSVQGDVVYTLTLDRTLGADESGEDTDDE